MTLTILARDSVLDRLYGGVAFSPPATYYLALSTTTPTTGGANITEPTEASYARQEISNDKVTGFENASAGSLTNASDITFPVSTGAWGTITYAVLFDAETAGDAWSYTPLSPSIIVQTATELTFEAGSLTFTQT